jgi:hypothetical protein
MAELGLPLFLIAGISFPLQFQRICSIMLIPAISQWQEAYCSYKSQNWFPAGNVGKRSAMNVNRLSAISSL